MMKNIFSIIYRQVIDDIRLYIFHALFRISINYSIVFFIATIIDRYILYYISIYFVKWRITRYFQLFQVIDNIYLLLPIIRISMIAIHFITFVIKKKKKRILLLLSFHSSRKVFFRKRFQPGERGNLIFKNVAQITERMYEARLVDTLCRGFTQPSELRPPKIVLEQSKLLSYGRARNFSSDQPGTK